MSEKVSYNRSADGQIVRARATTTSKLGEMLRCQLQLDLFIGLHEEVLDATGRQDSVLGEKLLRLVQVNVVTRRVHFFLCLARRGVVSKRDQITRPLPLGAKKIC